MFIVDNCRVFIWFLTLAGLIVICLYGVEESTTLVNELDLVFRGNTKDSRDIKDPKILSCV